MKYYKKFFYIKLLLLLLQVRAFSQTHHTQFDNISINDGLSQSSVRAILQDSRGFLWFGTQDGLNLYDGYDFKIFKTIKGDSNSISNNFINDIQEDSDGFIWTATKDGINKYDHVSNSFRRINLKNYFSGSNLSPSILSILTFNSNQNRDIWFTSSDGVFKYNSTEDNLKLYSFLENSVNIQMDNKIYLHRDNTNNIWAFTNMSGIYKYNKHSDEFEKVIIVNDRITKSLIQLSAVFEDSDGIFWFGSINGLNKYNRFTNELEIYYDQLIDKIGERITNGFINSVTEDNSGNLWIATSGYGLIVFNKETEEVNTYRHDEVNNKSISLNVAHTIYKDATGIIWIGTDGSGVDKMSPYLNNFKLVNNNNSGISISSVRCFFEDYTGHIWISGYDGLDRLDINSGKYTSYYSKSPSNKKISQIAYSIVEDRFMPDRYLYFGTEGDGVYRYDFHSETFSRIYYSDISYGDNIILALLDDGKYLWAGTNNGLIKIDKATGGLNRFSTISDDSISTNLQSVTSLFEDKKGNFWIGTAQSGLYLMDRENEKFISFNKLYLNHLPSQNKSNEYFSYGNFSVKCIQESKSGVIWIGTTDGLLKLIDSSKTFINYSMDDGLPNNVIYGILEDDDGNLWMSTNFGISMFNPMTGIFKNYEYQDGLQSNVFNTNAYLKTDKGLFFFGGIKGYNFFDPSDLERNSVIPKIVFTDFYLFNKRLNVGEEIENKIILNKTINETDTLLLDYKENIFTIYFAALDYSTPGKNLYSYKLDGFENEFSIPTVNRYVTYTNLDPDEYRLTVRGSNNSDVWNTKGKSLLIIIKPPFWLTWWFYLIVGCVIIIILYSIYKYRINKILELERLRVKIASDLHDEVGSTLTKVSFRAQMLESETNNSKSAANLKRISEQAREAVSTMRDIVWSIDSRYDTINDLVTKMKDTSNNLLSDTGLVIQFEVESVNLGKDLKPHFRQNIFLVFREALNNIVKHSNATEIVVIFRKFGEGVELIINDNGDTFQTKNEYSGQGLRNMQMRAEKIGGKVSFESNEGFKVTLLVPKL